MLARREVGLNGMAPSVNLLNTRTVPPGKDVTLFNPFYSLDHGLDYSSIRYDIQLVGRSDTVSASALVKPERWQPKTDLVLPLQGRILVHDGHDFYSHHRRMDMALLRSFKVLKRQFNRYAYDFVLVDSMGRMNRTGGKTNEDWFGYGATVFATGDGIVRSAVNDAAEHHLPDANWSQDETLSNPRGIPGNNVVIDHGNGECSAMAHLKQGSVRVKVGIGSGGGSRSPRWVCRATPTGCPTSTTSSWTAATFSTRRACLPISPGSLAPDSRAAPRPGARSTPVIFSSFRSGSPNGADSACRSRPERRRAFP
jgi:hypothetical protein